MDDLDWKRHLSELRHQVLPVFLAVLACLAALLIWMAPAEKAVETQEEDSEPSRVALLNVDEEGDFDPAFILLRPVELARAPLQTRVDFPLGSAGGAFSYNAQPFLENKHLGEDFNGIGGWDSDLGDAVYAVADGEVVYAGWPADGWGRVLTVLHRDQEGQLFQTFYAHLNRIDLPVGARVRRGQKLGTVGKGDGRYLAHLHFEFKDGSMIAAGPGYADQSRGRRSGEQWILSSRVGLEDRLNRAISGPSPNASESVIGVNTNVSH
ncbi:MAG: M23 family metallopeptidase [Verrucomicrobiales bacterium]|nr:M23 family metallopeptidase [Verrucomicrobiales bacterium]